ncbi:MAG: DUF2085 domain-containing protein [Methanomassiliicoccales archaeon]|nr:MAG: DUF2085 domain-containing protein [Methanomassiliicoccales archaeon]
MPDNSKWGRVGHHLHLFLSHHPVNQKEHIIDLTFRNHRLVLCARCSGILFGFILAIAPLSFLPSTYPVAANGAYYVLLTILALVFATTFLSNWTVPYVSRGKITRNSRFRSGFLCGIGLAIVLITRIPLLRVVVIFGVLYIIAVKTVYIFKNRRRRIGCSS